MKPILLVFLIATFLATAPAYSFIQKWKLVAIFSANDGQKTITVELTEFNDAWSCGDSAIALIDNKKEEPYVMGVGSIDLKEYEVTYTCVLFFEK